MPFEMKVIVELENIAASIDQTNKLLLAIVIFTFFTMTLSIITGFILAGKK